MKPKQIPLDEKVDDTYMNKRLDISSNKQSPRHKNWFPIISLKYNMFYYSTCVSWKFINKYTFSMNLNW